MPPLHTLFFKKCLPISINCVIICFCMLFLLYAFLCVKMRSFFVIWSFLYWIVWWFHIWIVTFLLMRYRKFRNVLLCFDFLVFNYTKEGSSRPPRVKTRITLFFWKNIRNKNKLNCIYVYNIQFNLFIVFPYFSQKKRGEKIWVVVVVMQSFVWCMYVI